MTPRPAHPQTRGLAPDARGINDALEDLFLTDAGVVEIRVLETGTARCVGGYFDRDHLDVAVDEVIRVTTTTTAKGIYVTVNPCKPDLLARSPNRIADSPTELTHDGEIARRHGLFFDVDVVRPSDLSSTDEEHALALALAEQLRQWLIARGVPADSIVVIDSGNGAHLLVRVDLPNDPTVDRLVKQCLAAAAAFVGSVAPIDATGRARVTLDTKVYNASRIIRLPGTLARKGPDSAERPHRLDTVISQPMPLAVCLRAVLDEIAALAPITSPRPSGQGGNGSAAANGVTFPEGERNDGLFREACALRAKGWKDAAILDAIAGLNRTACTSPLPDDEVQTIVASATRYPAGDARWRSTAPPTSDTSTSPDTEPRGGNGPDPASPAEWPEPDWTILDPPQQPAPPFPLEVLPARWGDWVSKAARAKSAPVDYVGCGLLSCAGSVLGNARWASPWDGWAEPPTVWHAAVGLPSSGKSPGLDAPRSLLEHLEREANTDRPSQLRQWTAATALAAMKHKAWEATCLKALKKGEAPPPLPDDATGAARPLYRRFLTNDPTVEKVARLALDNPKGLLVFRDELAGWVGGMDRYGGVGSDRAFYLESHGGRRFAVDRVKDAEPIVVPALTVTILGGIQPDRLRTMLLNGDDDGLVARFLWTWPERVPPQCPSGQVDDVTDWFARLSALSLAAGREREVVQFAEGAAAALQAYRLETAAAELEATGLYRSWLGKLPGFAVRIADILEHLAWCSTPAHVEAPGKISEREAVAAIAYLATYAVPMAVRCFGESAWPQADQDAQTLARWLLKQTPIPETFNLNHVRRHHAPLGREAARYHAAIPELVAAGWVRSVPRPKGLGPPAKDWAVNPKVRTRTGVG